MPLPQWGWEQALGTEEIWVQTEASYTKHVIVGGISTAPKLSFLFLENSTSEGVCEG